MTVVFGVEFDKLSPDLAEALRTFDSARLRIIGITGAEAVDARLVEAGGEVAESIATAGAEAAGSGAEIIAIGDPALSAEALDAGAADFIETSADSRTLSARLDAAARRLTRLRSERGDFERLRQLDAIRIRVARADTDLKSLAQMMCDELLASHHLRAMTKADGAVVEIVEGDEVVFLATSGIVSAHREFRLGRSGSLSGEVLRSGDILVVEDTEEDGRVNRAAARALGVRSMVATPLIAGGEAVGTLKIVASEPGVFGSIDLRILRSMGEMVSGALQREIERSRLRDRLAEHGKALAQLREESETLRSLATIDPLTGLLNRRQFAILADEAVRRGGARAMLLLDLDGFKSVNDAHGHAAGDAVLVAVAGWINATIRDGDLVARIGGEEFAILLPRVDQDAAIATAERIRAAIEAGVVPFEGAWIRTTASIGVALVGIARTHEDALRRADAALYRSKDSGRNRVIFHDDSNVVAFSGSVLTP